MTVRAGILQRLPPTGAMNKGWPGRTSKEIRVPYDGGRRRRGDGRQKYEG